jgi:hypothetical protein
MADNRPADSSQKKTALQKTVPLLFTLKKVAESLDLMK